MQTGIPELDSYVDTPDAKRARLQVPKEMNNVLEWADRYKDSFVPPICNKLMYASHLKVMFVGGPNTRRDFHFEAGDEFFYQIRGNIELPIYECGQPKIVRIPQGHVFLLPRRIPHSPQRPEEGSLGLVIERERYQEANEIDALRYYCLHDPQTILWQKWFYCHNLGTQLKPVVGAFMESEEAKTDQPGDVPPAPSEAMLDDTETTVQAPFDLMEFIEANRPQLNEAKSVVLFDQFQTNVTLFTGPFEVTEERPDNDRWFYLVSGDPGSATVSFPGSDRPSGELKQSDCFMVAPLEQYSLQIASEACVVMRVIMHGRPEAFSA